MTRGEAISQLRAHADGVRAMGATSLFLFGSTVRDDARADSDLDLFIDDDPESRFDGFDLVGIKLFPENRLGTEVDVTTRNSLHPRLRERNRAIGGSRFLTSTPDRGSALALGFVRPGYG